MNPFPHRGRTPFEYLLGIFLLGCVVFYMNKTMNKLTG